MYLIDSGAAINLISPEYIIERKFELILKKEPYILNLVDRKATRY